MRRDRETWEDGVKGAGAKVRNLLSRAQISQISQIRPSSWQSRAERVGPTASAGWRRDISTRLFLV